MFKTIAIIVMAVLCLNFNSRSQSQKTLPLPTKQAILGKIISSITGEALSGAVIKVTTLKHTVVSTNKGEFILALSNGAYNLSVSHIGYKTKNLNIQIPLKEQLVISLETDDLPNNIKEEQLVQSKIIKPLKIGDTIPDAVWNMPLQVVNHPEGKKTITLNDYKGKLIILDFWATWCSSCLMAFPEMESLQKLFSKNIEIIAVNSKAYGDTKQKVNATLAKVIDKENIKLSFQIVINDSVLKATFPHNILPHYIWINNGVVKAFTDSYEVTSNNISAILNNTAHDFVIKSDKSDFIYGDSFRENLGKSIDSSLLFTSLITGYIPGVSSSKNVVVGKTHTRYYFLNRPLIALYHYAFDCSANRIITDLKTNGSLPFTTKDVPAIEMDGWRKNHLYSYELIVPNGTTKKVMLSKMLSDLNSTTGYTGKMEKRRVPGFVLTKFNTDTIEYSSKSKRSMLLNKLKDSLIVTNSKLKQLVSNLNYYVVYKPNLPIIIDESNYLKSVDLKLPASSMQNVNALNKSLNEFGFKLSPEFKEIDMFVITDAPTAK